MNEMKFSASSGRRQTSAFWENWLYLSMYTDQERAHLCVRHLTAGSSIGLLCSEQWSKPQPKVLKALI
ncbi:hypothetical protein HD883_003774 [Pigmentiphaga litoralis]|uniref:hypothetical protein n=1 Tax=Pigmentiphaga litoralis TaxID=516702 RepID=UPI0015CC47DF|nr:hypothetical protein [Pigmentiphaga litoralis]NYE25380.1 hypothetical protein [Pigmentiphaga litoralis]